jgi:uncharacterized protein (TIGR02246 family)
MNECLAKRIAVLAIALLAASCATTQRGEVEVRAFVERFVQSVNASDTDAFVACFATDATAFFPSGATASRRTGSEAIRRSVRPVFAQGPRNPPAQLTDLVITVQDAMAVASFDARDGATHSRRTLVMRKIAGEWKIVHLHASNVTEAS